MNSEIEKEIYIFVIDTENYSGNFVAEMGVYLTGLTPNYNSEAISQYSRAFIEEEGVESDDLFSDLIMPDKRGSCDLPSEIYPTKGWFNHGYGGHFPLSQKEEALLDYKRKMEQYLLEKIYKNEAFKREHFLHLAFDQNYCGWTQESIDYEINSLKEQLQKLYDLKEVNCHPAYLSVALSFWQKPSDDVLNLLLKRAKAFCKLPEMNITFIGCRLLKEVTYKEELREWNSDVISNS